VVKHLEETILVTILMLLIGVRIIIQLLFVLLIPAAAFGVLYLFMAANLPQLAVFLASTVAVVGLIFAAYLNAMIHVFAVSVWTFTFLKLTSEKLPSARDVVHK
jgi:hypothetical protein